MASILFEWSDSFRIGIEELDHEHQVLIADINKLHEEMVGNEDISKIKDCLGEIYVHMQAHFALEEHVMKENEYPFYDDHKREHEQFLGDFTECMVQFLNGADISAKDPIEECLKQWIVDHITTSDRKMALMVQDETP